MRLCTNCISCTNRLPLPKRALFPAEPPPNRPQISDRTAALPETICADGQEENTGKRTSQKHPNSFPSSGKGRVAVFDGPAIQTFKRCTALFEVTRDFVISCRQGASLNWT